MANSALTAHGTAAIATLLPQREQFHSNRIGKQLSIYDPIAQKRINQYTQFFVIHRAAPATAQEPIIYFQGRLNGWTQR